MACRLNQPVALPSKPVHLHLAAAISRQEPSLVVYPQRVVAAGVLAVAAAEAVGKRQRLRRRLQRSHSRLTTLFARRVDADDDNTNDSYEDRIAISLEGATVRRGPEVILGDVDLDVTIGERAVIVGPNGCGKTTLLSTMAGLLSLETGQRFVRDTSLGWLRQEATAGSTRTVMEEAVTEMPALIALHELEKKGAKLGSASTPAALAAAQAEYDAAAEQFEALGGYDYEAKAARVLIGLKFTKEDFGRPCSELSGGWQMKVALARALLREPELLLLDEPTNHMDSETKKWLAHYLSHELPRKTTLFVVTHDRSLLENLRLTTVLEISEKRVMTFECTSIGDWEERRKDRGDYLKKEIAKLEKSAAADALYISKWGAKAAFATMAQARAKKLDKTQKQIAVLKAETRGLPSEDKGTTAGEEKPDGMLPLAAVTKVKLRLPTAPLHRHPPPGNILLSLEGMDIGHVAEKPAIKNVSFVAATNTRTVLLGPNGCGKTTMLRTLAGTLSCPSGHREVGVSKTFGPATVALFTQDLAQDLPSDMTPVEYLSSVAVNDGEARAALGALGLRSGAHLSRIGDLSGGEKGRVALALFTLNPADVLLLDEPTNHLDGIAVKALAEGLREVAGAAIIVSTHDQAFIDALQITHTVHITKATPEQPGSALCRTAEGDAAARPMAGAKSIGKLAPEAKVDLAKSALDKRQKALAAAW
jgi:ATP-binding cassette, subfamily F, member 3